MEITHIRAIGVYTQKKINEKLKKIRVLQNIFNCRGHIFITRLYIYI